MRRFAVVLLGAAPLIASAACSQLPPPVALDRCPPRAAGPASSGPHLAAGGRGIGPRDAPQVVDEGITSASSNRLASGGRGVPERVESGSPSVAASDATPHLAAGGRGVSPRTECE